jgi:hypothetical protein
MRFIMKEIYKDLDLIEVYREIYNERNLQKR